MTQHEFGIYGGPDGEEVLTLLRGLRIPSIVLLPYDSTEQVTSGVLIEAIAAKRPVVATVFPHAVELLAEGVGVVVPHRNPDALADGLWRILHHPEVAQEMSHRH